MFFCSDRLSAVTEAFILGHRYLRTSLYEEDMYIYNIYIYIKEYATFVVHVFFSYGPEHTAPLCLATGGRVFCGGDIYSRRKPLFSSFGEHTAVCGSNVRQAVARPRHRQSVFVAACHFLIIFFYVAATCRPSVLGSATKTRPPVAKLSGQCARALMVKRNFRNFIFWPKFSQTCT